MTTLPNVHNMGLGGKGGVYYFVPIMRKESQDKIFLFSFIPFQNDVETAWKSLLQRRLASKTDRAQTSESIDDKSSASDTGNSLGKSAAASVLPRTSDNVPQNTDVSRAFHQNKHEIHHPLESEVYSLSFDRITELRNAASVQVKYDLFLLIPSSKIKHHLLPQYQVFHLVSHGEDGGDWQLRLVD